MWRLDIRDPELRKSWKRRVLFIIIVSVLAPPLCAYGIASYLRPQSFWYTLVTSCIEIGGAVLIGDWAILRMARARLMKQDAEKRAEGHHSPS